MMLTPACTDASKRMCANGKLANPSAPMELSTASVEDGWTGLAFIETALKSSADKGAWTSMPKKA